MEHTKEELKRKGVYKITNIVNGKFYIGSAASNGGFHKRWREHKNLLNNNSHYSTHLQRAWNKYGETNFMFEILETVNKADMIINREQYYLDLFKPYNAKTGYNKCVIAGSTLGIKHSEESNMKLRGLKKSEETKNKMRLGNSGEKSGHAKLTNAQANEIRERYRKDKITFKELGKQYGIVASCVFEIIKNKTYINSNYEPPILTLTKPEKTIIGSKIRNHYKNTKTSISELSKIYDLSRTQIHRIINNKSYK